MTRKKIREIEKYVVTETAINNLRSRMSNRKNNRQPRRLSLRDLQKEKKRIRNFIGSIEFVAAACVALIAMASALPTIFGEGNDIEE